MESSCDSHPNTQSKTTTTHETEENEEYNLILFLLLNKKTIYTLTTTINLLNYTKTVNNWKFQQFEELENSFQPKAAQNPKTIFFSLLQLLVSLFINFSF